MRTYLWRLTAMPLPPQKDWRQSHSSLRLWRSESNSKAFTGVHPFFSLMNGNNKAGSNSLFKGPGLEIQWMMIQLQEYKSDAVSSLCKRQKQTEIGGTVLASLPVGSQGLSQRKCTRLKACSCWWKQRHAHTNYLSVYHCISISCTIPRAAYHKHNNNNNR